VTPRESEVNYETIVVDLPSEGPACVREVGELGDLGGTVGGCDLRGWENPDERDLVANGIGVDDEPWGGECRGSREAVLLDEPEVLREVVRARFMACNPLNWVWRLVQAD
jgi:hypothetical protein